MSVIIHRQTKMAAGVLAGPLHDVRPAAHQLDYRERNVRKMIRIGRSLLVQKRGQCRLIRLLRQVKTVLGGDADDAVPTLGHLYNTPDRQGSVVLEKLRHLDVRRYHEV